MEKELSQEYILPMLNDLDLLSEELLDNWKQEAREQGFKGGILIFKHEDEYYWQGYDTKQELEKTIGYFTCQDFFVGKLDL